MAHVGPFQGWRVMAYLSGEMSPEEQHRFESHLARCPSCAHEVESRRAVIALLETDRTAAVEVSTELGQRIRARLREQESAAALRSPKMPRAVAAAVAMCLLAVGLTIGYMAGRPDAQPPGLQRLGELPEADEELLLRNIMTASQRLVDSGATEEAASLGDVGRYLEQLAKLRGGDISHIHIAMKPSAPVLDQPTPGRSATFEEQKKAWEDQIATYPGTSRAAIAQLRLAELFFDDGRWPQARAAYASFRTNYPDEYEQYAGRAQVDQRMRVLAESEKSGYRTLADFRRAATLEGRRAYDTYERILRWQPVGDMARATVMEMARFEWADGEPSARRPERFGSPEEKIAALNTLIEHTNNPDTGALALATIADIYWDELDDVDRANEAYETLLRDYIETRVAREAIGKVNELRLAVASELK